jgi:phosphoribosyl 1,2-cyclic phosphodiesterase
LLTARSLASGSSGNAFVVGNEHVSLVLDAGLSARRLLHHLDAMWVDRERVAGVVLTHEHGDHSCGALALARELDVPLYATGGTASALRLAPEEWVRLEPERSFEVAGLSVTPFPVVHDGAEPVGLLVDAGGHRVALATDLGSIDHRTLDWARQADLLILDTNHDLNRLWNGPYPASLKRRIASPHGHLSNVEAARCIELCVERGQTRRVWLAHLSETNNTQRMALRTVTHRLRGATVAIEVARRHRPSLTWRSTMALVQGRLL